MLSARPFALALALLLATGAQAGPVNDTGFDFCRNHATGADTAVTLGTTCTPLPTHGAQDARYGRDAAALKGQLPKVGASAGTAGGNPNGFDYTKVSDAGADLPANASLGPNPGDWACTRDNHTGLLWEVKVDNAAHLRHMEHTYTWYISANTYGGHGTPATITGGNTCQTLGRCDTEKFVQDVNAQGLCGHADWRLPSLPELYNLADRGRSNPAIDPVYFPNTQAWFFWSGSPIAGFPDRAWGVYFYYGNDNWGYRSGANRVRLVRGGQ